MNLAQNSSTVLDANPGGPVVTYLETQPLGRNPLAWLQIIFRTETYAFKTAIQSRPFFALLSNGEKKQHNFRNASFLGCNRGEVCSNTQNGCCSQTLRN